MNWETTLTLESRAPSKSHSPLMESLEDPSQVYRHIDPSRHRMQPEAHRTGRGRR